MKGSDYTVAETERRSEDTDDGDGSLGGQSRRSVLASLGVGAAGLALGSSVEPAAASNVAESPAGVFADGSEPATTAIRNGAWSDSRTWDNGVPSDGQDARIDPGVTVRLGTTTSDVKTLDVAGTFAFRRTTDSELRAETVVTRPDSTLHIGTESNPIQSGTTATVTFVHHEDISAKDDPTRVSKGLVPMGEFEVHGAETSGWHGLETAPTGGDTTLELAEAPTGWQQGDDIVVPGVNPDSDEDEERTIAGINGSTVTLASALAYDHSPPDHSGDTTLSAYALNLSRNVVFRSAVQATDPENEAKVNRQGHVMVMGTNSSVHNARFRHVGRTNKRYYFTNNKYGEVPDRGRFVPDEPNSRARYAFHYHETGIADDARHEASGLVVQDSPGWGVVNHHSNADVTNSVSYRVLGAGFVTEGGDERGSFVNNFALRSRGSGQKIDARQADAPQGNPETDVATAGINDFGHAGHGFWLQGPAVAVEDNVAAGHRAYAFSIWNRALYDEDRFDANDFRTHAGLTPNMPLDLAEADGLLFPESTNRDTTNDSEITTAALKLKSFSDNTAFAAAGGLDISNHNNLSRVAHEDESEFSEVAGFTAHSIRRFVNWQGDPVPDIFGGNLWGEFGNVGIATRYSDNVRITDATLVNNTDEGYGIRPNFYPKTRMVEDSHIEGFDVGIQTLDDGYDPLERLTLNNQRNVLVNDIGDADPLNVPMQDLTFEGSGTGIELRHPGRYIILNQLFSANGPNISLDGRTIYYDQQAPDHVPFETEEAIENQVIGRVGNPWNENFGLSGEAEAKSELVGLSNRELQDQFGTSVYGELLPSSAVDDGVVAGGKIEPASDDGSSGGSTADGVRIDTDVTIVERNAGIAFRIRDTENFYMWQLKRAGDGGPYLRPHVRENGEWTMLEEIDVSSEMGSAPNNITIEAAGSTITTWINGTQVDERSDETFGPGGNVGYREALREEAWYHNLTVSDLDGATRYADSFDRADNPHFDGGFCNGQVLVVEGNQIAQLQRQWDDYVVETDVEILERNAGVCFRVQDDTNLYMWQINRRNDGGPYLRPHVRENGEWTVLEEIDIGEAMGSGPNTVTIDADGSTITTTVNGTQVDQRTDDTFDSGRVGFRQGIAERAQFDELSVTDGTTATLFADSFDHDGVEHFDGGAIEDGTLEVDGPQVVQLTE